MFSKKPSIPADAINLMQLLPVQIARKPVDGAGWAD